MSLAKKGSRSLTVNGHRYRWSGVLPGHPSERASVVVEAWEDPGQRMVAHFDPWVLSGEEPRGYLGARLVRAAILEGLRRGWRPDRVGPQLEVTEEQLYGEQARPRWIEDAAPRRLLDAILAVPEQDEPRLVLADWLMERGDPRGELITLQCAQAARRLDRDGGAAKERIATLLERHWRRWSAPAHRVARRWAFDRGFIDRVTCSDVPSRKAWEALHRNEPVREVELSLISRSRHLEALSWLPQRSTRALSLRGGIGALGIERLIAAPGASSLRRLGLGSADVTDQAADVLAGAERLGELEELDLSYNPLTAGGVWTILDSPRLASLRRVVVDRDRLPPETIEEVERRGWTSAQGAHGPLELRRR